MVEKLNTGSVDMEKLMPDTLRRFLARRFAERAAELGEVAVVYMNARGRSGKGSDRLFVLSDSADEEISRLQCLVNWIRAEVCPNNDCLKVLGDVKVVGLEKFQNLTESANCFQPVVCIADYSGDD